MLSEMTEGWSFYVSLSHLEFGSCETLRDMPFEVSQEVTSHISSYGACQSFTELGGDSRSQPEFHGACRIFKEPAGVSRSLPDFLKWKGSGTWFLATIVLFSSYFCIAET
jgi:hypothetical protein